MILLTVILINPEIDYFIDQNLIGINFNGQSVKKAFSIFMHITYNLVGSKTAFIYINITKATNSIESQTWYLFVVSVFTKESENLTTLHWIDVNDGTISLVIT